MRGVTKGKASLNAGVTFIGLTVFPGRHTNDFLPPHFGLESAANTTVSACGRDRVLGNTFFDDAVFGERCGRTGRDAGAAGDAVRLHEVCLGSDADTRVKTAPRDGQCKSALSLLASPDAARTNNALRGIKGEVGTAFIFLQLRVILTSKAVTHVSEADLARGRLQLTVPVGRTGETIQRVVTDIQLHYAATNFCQLIALSGYRHTRLNGCGAGRGIPPTAFNVDQAHAA